MLSRRHLLIAAPALAAPVFAAPAFAGSPALRLATFEADVTPPIGSPLCVSLVPDAARIESRLSARGVVLYPSGQQPIVLCAVDWLGIGNGAMSAWKLALARVVRTQPSRVAVHTVHQHDAPGQDDSAYALLKQRGRTHLLQPAAFASIAVQRTAAAAGLAKPQTISHFATGEAAVSDIASNRRILSPDGKAFLFQRFTACRNSAYCDAPVGTIDPNLKTVSFYNGPLRIASLHYYATHPMSYYGKGVVNADFVGIARSAVQSAAAGFPVYFTGAAGNIGAGKYNDGDPANRARLAGRLADAMPDKSKFPTFDNKLRAAMRRETELFFESVMREDRSLITFLDADYSYLNEPLARHYGIEGVSGDEFREVSLAGTQRGGLITQASILTVTSNPTRTSPVKRGKWVLENLLADPPPPPPPNVPELDKGELKGTLRQQMEQHRVNAACATCHQRLDPLGFALENFDAVGAWRDRDGTAPVDASGELPGGEKFNGAAALRALLVKTKKEAFLRCMAEKMLTYALGRGLEYYDKCSLDRIVIGLSQNENRMSVLVTEIVNSEPFTRRRTK
mgnify:CR=1 FL=1